MTRLEDAIRDSLTAHEHEAPDATGLLHHVHAHTGRSRARMRLAVGAAAASAAAVVLVVALLHPAERTPGPLAAQRAKMIVPAGMQAVSYHGAQLLVPGSWRIDDTRCGTPTSDTVVLESPDLPMDACAIRQPPGLTVVRLTTTDTGLGRDRAALATTPVRVDGRPAQRGAGVPSGQQARLHVLVLPEVDTVISVESPDDAAASRILDSVHLAVPADANGCPAQVASLAPPAPTGNHRATPGALAVDHPSTATVCWYTKRWLTRSVPLKAADVTALQRLLTALPTGATGAAAAARARRCLEDGNGFLIRTTDADGSVRRVYVHIACDQPYAATNGYTTGVTKALVQFLIASTGYTGPVADLNTL